VSDTPTPQPAEPSEGAGFYWGKDIPSGWEWRGSFGDDWTDSEGGVFGPVPDCLYEARPKPEPLVAVMLPHKYVTEYVDAHQWTNPARYEEFFQACRAALVAESDQ
jgi:hypothetical protein